MAHERDDGYPKAPPVGVWWLLVIVVSVGWASGPACRSDGGPAVPDSGADGSAGDADRPVRDADRPVRDADRPVGDADRPVGDADPDADSRPDGQAPSCEDMSADCVSEFGTLFTDSNGRADGTLVALVEPADTQCPLFNGDHVVLEVMMLDQVQRLVVSVDGVAVHRVTAPLVGPAFSEGWHTDVHLDYSDDLGVHSTDFTPVTMAEAVLFACSELEVGSPVSVFAYSDGSRPSSAHQVHWNDRYPDGAIVAHPTSEAATYLLFRYLDDVF